MAKQRDAVQSERAKSLPCGNCQIVSSLSGNGASTVPAADDEAATPEPSAVTSADRDGDDAGETPATEGEQLRVL